MLKIYCKKHRAEVISLLCANIAFEWRADVSFIYLCALHGVPGEELDKSHSISVDDFAKDA